jgi:putative ABC transport system permease protein
MESFAELESIYRVGLALALVLLAAIISRWQKADLEKDLLVATVRAFVQLIAIGFALELIFEQDSPLWTLLVLVIMMTIASRVTGRRTSYLPHSFWLAFSAIGIGTVSTTGVLVVLGVFEFVPDDMIPIGGMIIGNSMTTASLVMTRLSDDLTEQHNQIESMLALGATSRQSSLVQFRKALRSAMIPIIDTTKTVGLIKLPGAMTGMILAGASPLEAVQLQIIVMYMLVGANSFTGLSAAYLTYRQFFTPHHQLKTIPHESST